MVTVSVGSDPHRHVTEVTAQRPFLHRDFSLALYILYLIFTRLVKYGVNSRRDILSFCPYNQMASKCF